MSTFRAVLALPDGVLRFIGTEMLLGIGIGILTMIQNLHMLALHIDPQQIGMITSAGTLAAGLVGLPAGMLVTRLGRKRMLTAGMLLMGAATAGFGLGFTQLHMLLAMLTWSVGLTFLVTSEIQLLFQYCSEKKQETLAYSMLFAVFTLFTGVGTLLGGYLPGLLGGMTTLYQNTFYLGAACIAAGAVLRAILLPVDKPAKRPPPERSTYVSANPPLRRSSPVKLLILSGSVFLFSFSFNIAGPYANVIVQYRYGWSDEQVSLLLSANGFALFIGSLLMPMLLERLGPAKAFDAVFALNVLFSFALGIPLGAYWFAAVLVVRGGCFTLLNNMIESETMSAVPEAERNRFAALRSVFRAGGGALAAYVGGIVLQSRNTLLPYWITAVGLLVTWAWVRWAAMPRMRAERGSEADL
ncbi:MFS transporter [Paenibacillus chartarius]|uniref:MFS transporter n=1 Tax=Paenibacillus chartarius TaxID=747481 RepID=A0ABV6DSN3_9BACL